MFRILLWLPLLPIARPPTPVDSFPSDSSGLVWGHSNPTSKAKSPPPSLQITKQNPTLSPGPKARSTGRGVPKPWAGEVSWTGVQGDAGSHACHHLIRWRLSLSFQVVWKTGRGDLGSSQRFGALPGRSSPAVPALHFQAFSKPLSSKPLFLYLQELLSHSLGFVRGKGSKEIAHRSQFKNSSEAPSPKVLCG